MKQATLDLTRPTAVYLGLAIILLLVAFVQSRLPLPSLSTVFAIANARAVAGGLICASVACGLLGAQRLAARAQEPWRVPLSQSFILFVLFFVLGALGLGLSV